jgi:hypothetical protein
VELNGVMVGFSQWKMRKGMIRSGIGTPRSQKSPYLIEFTPETHFVSKYLYRSEIGSKQPRKLLRNVAMALTTRVPRPVKGVPAARHEPPPDDESQQPERRCRAWAEVSQLGPCSESAERSTRQLWLTDGGRGSNPDRLWSGGSRTGLSADISFAHHGVLFLG